MILEPTRTGNLFCPVCWRRGRAAGNRAVCYGGPRPDGMRRECREKPHPRAVCVRIRREDQP